MNRLRLSRRGRLLVEVGNGCATIMDEQMRDLSCRRIQVDEIWVYVQKKQRWVTPQDDQLRTLPARLQS